MLPLLCKITFLCWVLWRESALGWTIGDGRMQVFSTLTATTQDQFDVHSGALIQKNGVRIPSYQLYGEYGYNANSSAGINFKISQYSGVKNERTTVFDYLQIFHRHQKRWGHFAFTQQHLFKFGGIYDQDKMPVFAQSKQNDYEYRILLGHHLGRVSPFTCSCYFSAAELALRERFGLGFTEIRADLTLSVPLDHKSSLLMQMFNLYKVYSVTTNESMRAMSDIELRKPNISKLSIGVLTVLDPHKSIWFGMIKQVAGINQMNESGIFMTYRYLYDGK